MQVMISEKKTGKIKTKSLCYWICKIHERRSAIVFLEKFVKTRFAYKWLDIKWVDFLVNSFPVKTFDVSKRTEIRKWKFIIQSFLASLACYPAWDFWLFKYLKE